MLIYVVKVNLVLVRFVILEGKVREITLKMIVLNDTTFERGLHVRHCINRHNICVLTLLKGVRSLLC